MLRPAVNTHGHTDESVSQLAAVPVLRIPFHSSADVLLKMSYGTNDGFDIEHHGKNFKIKLSDACKYDQRWMLAKYRIITDLREILGAETITFLEEYEKPQKKEEAEGAKKEEKPEEPAKTERAPEELTEEDRKS